MLRTSEASNATLTNNLAALQQRASGIAIGEFRPNRPPQVSTTKGETPGTGVPTLPEAGDAEAEAAAKAEREAADALAGELLAVEAEEELPTSVDDLQRGMRHERARVRLLQAEVSQVRDEMAEQLERQRRGADRGLREMQTEFARLHRSHVEMKEAVNASEQRAGGEAGFRRRAEQGWLAAQQSLERTQAELQQSRIQVGELEGRLNATSDLSSELSNARKTITTLQGKVAADDARLVELLESQKLNSQHVAVAMGHAQQHAAAEFERLQAEHQASHQQSQQNASWWRQRAEKAKNKMGAAAANLSASRSSLESLLGRLVTATSVADMADQSRLLFEIKAALLDVEELLRRPDSAGGAPPEGGKGGKGGGRKGGGSGPGGPTGPAPPPVPQSGPLTFGSPGGGIGSLPLPGIGAFGGGIGGLGGGGIGGGAFGQFGGAGGGLPGGLGGFGGPPIPGLGALPGPGVSPLIGGSGPPPLPPDASKGGPKARPPRQPPPGGAGSAAAKSRLPPPPAAANPPGRRGSVTGGQKPPPQPRVGTAGGGQRAVTFSATQPRG